MVARMDSSGTLRRARMSARKRRILDLLASSEPPGVILQNELRHRVLRAERDSGSAISLFNFNRSFNRTILEYSASHLSRFTLDVKDSAELTGGIAARFGIWQLVEKGYVSALPDARACAVVVGDKSFSVLGTLVDRTRALLYSGEIEQINFVSSGDVRGTEWTTTTSW